VAGREFGVAQQGAVGGLSTRGACSKATPLPLNSSPVGRKEQLIFSLLRATTAIYMSHEMAGYITAANADIHEEGDCIWQVVRKKLLCYRMN